MNSKMSAKTAMLEAFESACAAIEKQKGHFKESAPPWVESEAMECMKKLFNAMSSYFHEDSAQISQGLRQMYENPLPSPQLYDRAEAATRLSISLRMMDELMATKSIEVVRIGRAVRFRPAALVAFIESNVHPAEAKK